jgi:hypothetical protein
MSERHDYKWPPKMRMLAVFVLAMGLAFGVFALLGGLGFGWQSSVPSSLASLATRSPRRSA